MSGCATKLKSLEFSWKITNYSLQRVEYQTVDWNRSQNFPADCEVDLKFVLGFYPEGTAQVVQSDDKVSNGEKWTSLILRANSNKTSVTRYHFELSVLDAQGEKFGSLNFHREIPCLLNFFKFIRLKDLENPANNLLQNDTLTIFCRVEETKSEFEEQSERKRSNCQIEEPPTKIARRKLCEDLASITDKFADFVFKMENEKIPAHRVILAAGSPVFAAMFQHDMEENRTNETEITDVTPAAFKALLQFIYTGHCEVGNLAEQLLVAANKYDIQDLKEICADELRMKMTVGNAVRLLVLSDLHQAEDLKDDAMRFINKNAPAVIKTHSWANFPETHQHLIRELYNKLFE
jgi:speckle-type POZ protein